MNGAFGGDFGVNDLVDGCSGDAMDLCGLAQALAERTIRFDAQTRTTSKRPRRASVIIWSRPRIRALAPEILRAGLDYLLSLYSTE